MSMTPEVPRVRPKKRVGTTGWHPGQALIPAVGIALAVLVAVGVGLAIIIARAGGTREDPVAIVATEPLREIPALTLAPCSATTPTGSTYDPCALEPEFFIASFWNPLKALPYFAKWQAANPGEWAMLNAWLRDGTNSAQPTVRTSFGALVRFGFAQCKAWAQPVSACNVP